MNQSFINPLFQILAWLIFLAFPLLGGPKPPHEDSFTSISYFAIRVAAHYLLFIGFFYLNYHVLVPEFYLKKNRVQYFLILLFIFIGTALLIRFVLFPDPLPHFGAHSHAPQFPEKHALGPHPPHLEKRFLHRFFNHNFFLFWAISFLSLMLRVQNQLRKTEEEKTIAELSYLKAQINPHFLFNTLNGIYALTLEKSDQAPDAIIKLSGLMRYVLTDATSDFIGIESEVNYITNYVELQKIRLDKTVELKFNTQIEDQDLVIAPLILISFIENAFKYGVGGDNPNFIHIRIETQNGYLWMEVANSDAADRHPENTGLGIMNAQTRLQLIYKDRFSLKIEPEKDRFYIHLKIQLR